MTRFQLNAAATLFALGLCTPAQAIPFDIRLSYTTPTTTGFEQAMDTAAQIWEYLLPSYSSTPSDVTAFGVANPLAIDVAVAPIDGLDGVLGEAGPDIFVISQDLSEIYTHTGSMLFDADDVARGGTFTQAVTLFLHEMAHVIGFGTMWDNSFFSAPQYDLTNGDNTLLPTQYSGANALAAYQAEVDATATFIPLEDAGGAGTAGSHWDEASSGSSFVPGNFFGDELMSGVLFDGPSTFVSATTVASFADIGYNTRANYSALTVDQLITIVQQPTPVPLPAAGVMLLAGIGALGWMRRRATKATH